MYNLMEIRKVSCNLIQGSIVGALTFIKRLLLGVTTVFLYFNSFINHPSIFYHNVDFIH